MNRLPRKFASDSYTADVSVEILSLPTQSAPGRAEVHVSGNLMAMGCVHEVIDLTKDGQEISGRYSNYDSVALNISSSPRRNQPPEPGRL